MKKLLLIIVLLAVSTATLGWIRYGGGEPYPNLSSTPLLNQSTLEEVLQYPEPLGNVAVAEGNRVFFTIHSEARPSGNKLLEFVEGASEPWPDGSRACSVSTSKRAV